MDLFIRGIGNRIRSILNDQLTEQRAQNANNIDYPLDVRGNVFRGTYSVRISDYSNVERDHIIQDQVVPDFGLFGGPSFPFSPNSSSLSNLQYSFRPGVDGTGYRIDTGEKIDPSSKNPLHYPSKPFSDYFCGFHGVARLVSFGDGTGGVRFEVYCIRTGTKTDLDSPPKAIDDNVEFEVGKFEWQVIRFPGEIS